MEKPNVWLDQDLCSGCGNCSKVAPRIFKLAECGVSVVHLEGEVMYDDGLNGRILEEHEVGPAIQAAAECPGEIIFIDI